MTQNDDRRFTALCVYIDRPNTNGRTYSKQVVQSMQEFVAKNHVLGFKNANFPPLFTDAVVTIDQLSICDDQATVTGQWLQTDHARAFRQALGDQLVHAVPFGHSNVDKDGTISEYVLQGMHLIPATESAFHE